MAKNIKYKNPKILFYKKLSYILLPLLILFSFAFYVSANYTFNQTESMPTGIYHITPYRGEKLHIGEVIVFPIPESVRSMIYLRDWENKNVKDLIKTVGATPEDTVTVQNGALYINGKQWGNIYTTDEQGKPIPHVSSSELQPKEGEILPLTPNPLSYDGRYFGCIPISDIKYTAYKVNWFDVIIGYIMYPITLK